MCYKMYCLDKICCICLYSVGNCEELFATDSEQLSYYFKLNESVPEMHFKEINEVRLMCRECCNTVDIVYNFRKKCLRSKRKLIDYISKLRSSDNVDCETSVNIYHIKLEPTIDYDSNCTKSSSDSSRIGKREKNYDVQHDGQSSEDVHTDVNEMETEIHAIHYLNCGTNVDNVNHEKNTHCGDLKQEDPLNLNSTNKEIRKRDSNYDIKMEEISCEIQSDNEKNNEENYFSFVAEGDTKTEIDIVEEALPACADPAKKVDSFLKHEDETNASNDGSLDENEAEDSVPENLDKAEQCSVSDQDNENATVSETKHEIPNKSHTSTKDLFRHTGEKYDKCDICNKTFTEKNYLKFHMTIHTGEKPFECKTCNKKFARKKYLHSHLRTHTGDKPYECSTCNKPFSDNKSFKCHLRKHTGEKPFQCNTCNKTFSSKKYLKIHLRIHTGEKPFECKLCSSRFSHKSTLNQHMLTHTGEKPFECKICGNIFAQKSNFRFHVLTHTGEKPFQCQICNNSFAQKGNLNNHMLIHTGEKKFDCTTCNKKFTHKRNLLNHMFIHTGDKPFECTTCKKTFSSKKYLQSHLRTHTGEKPFECKLCNNRFSHKSTLNQHMLTHTGEKPFECKLCNKRFTRKTTLEQHMLLHVPGKH